MDVSSLALSIKGVLFEGQRHKLVGGGTRKFFKFGPLRMHFLPSGAQITL